MKKASLSSVITGAAFLMATSAVGPGFLMQTTVFTKTLFASFGFVILLSVVLDIFAQLNIWRVLTVSGRRGQDVANATFAGSGHILSALIVFGGLVFNIGNLAGCGLGLNVIFGLPVTYGAALSALLAIALFLFKEAGRAMDVFVKALGVIMLGLIAYVVYSSNPPLGEAAYRSIVPAKIDFSAVVTLVGGTVGGYITFAGAHRLIDAGVTGVESLPQVNRGAVTGILLTAMIRVMLFLAALGIVTAGFALDGDNPPAMVFKLAAGEFGYRLFGVVLWSAAITSVVGAAFTSVSFLKTFSAQLEERSNFAVIAFILLSAIGLFLLGEKPQTLLIWAGTVNGFILPIGLALVLLASRRAEIVGDYVHPRWLSVAGWLVVVLMTAFSCLALYEKFTKIG